MVPLNLLYITVSSMLLLHNIWSIIVEKKKESILTNRFVLLVYATIAGSIVLNGIVLFTTVIPPIEWLAVLAITVNTICCYIAWYWCFRKNLRELTPTLEISLAITACMSSVLIVAKMLALLTAVLN